MVQRLEMRAAMAQYLDDLMQKDERIVVIDADLARAHGTLGLMKKHPTRAIDVGVAESNMTCMAAGLSAYGLLPIIFTFATFASRRNCDQVAVSVSYAKSNVKIVGSDPGISAELNGGTHMSVEDIGIMRAIPGILIFEPVDEFQLIKAMPSVLAYDGPAYIRLFRKTAPMAIFDNDNYEFNLFNADILKEGNDVTIAASGVEVKEALEAAKKLKEEGISAEVISFHTIKPLDEKTLINSVKKTKCLVSAENHNIIGGLGSACCESLAKTFPVPQEFIGFQDHFGEVGTIDYLRTNFSMDSKSIVTTCKKVIERK